MRASSGDRHADRSPGAVGGALAASFTNVGMVPPRDDASGT